MSRVQVWAWKCDRPGCDKIWYTTSDVPPKACAKCKARNWNTRVEIRAEDKEAFDSTLKALIAHPPITNKELAKKVRGSKKSKKISNQNPEIVTARVDDRTRLTLDVGERSDSVLGPAPRYVRPEGFKPIPKGGKK